MPEAKRPDGRRRSPASGPGRSGGDGKKAGRPQNPAAKSASLVRKEQPRPLGEDVESEEPSPHEPIRQSIIVSAERQSEQRLGSTARRAAILAAVVCVLTLTIAGPVRTYFAQRTEMNQLIATEAALREQIAELEQQKVKLADPAYIAAQARERLGFVMPGDIPYQVQLPPSAANPELPEALPGTTAPAGVPWYSALWKTIADDPHGPPPVAPAPPLPGAPAPPPPPPVPGG